MGSFCRHHFSKAFLLSALAVFLVLIGASCGGNTAVTSTSVPVNSNVNSAPAELELSGIYNVNGAGENGAGPYQGLLTITNQGDGYSFKWQTDHPRPGGVGVQMGDALAASFADPTKGKGCGVALYKIASDGSLDGRIADWGEYTFGSEKAVKVEGHNFDGKYKVTGTTRDGKAYEGTIDVEKNGSGYKFSWHTGSEMVGFGIWRGNRAAIGFGGAPCSFALYQVQSAKFLDGHWGSQRSVGFGTETAKRP